jgi:hypothetical protein
MNTINNLDVSDMDDFEIWDIGYQGMNAIRVKANNADEISLYIQHEGETLEFTLHKIYVDRLIQHLHFALGRSYLEIAESFNVFEKKGE